MTTLHVNVLNMHNNFFDLNNYFLGLLLNFNSLILILVMPVTNAVSDRSFSALHRAKT